MKRIFFVLAIATLLTRSGIAQDMTISPFHLGFRASYLENFHNTDAICPTCGQYSNGRGSGYAAQLFGEVPFNSFRRLDLTFGLGMADRGGSFGEALSSNLQVLDPNTNNYVPFVRQSSYSASLTYFDISGGLRLRPLARFAGYIGAGFNAGLPMGRSTTYVQTEKILSPSGVLYPETGTTTRTDSSGVIPGIQTSFGLTGTIGYEVPLSTMITAAPELSYFYPLNNVESGFRWHVVSLHASIALRWNKPPHFDAPPPPKPPPPIVQQREDPRTMAPKLAAVSLSGEPFHIIETTVTETFPILPYIFFDSASATLSDRFAQLTPFEIAQFRENELPHKSLESYYQILNVIGGRMRANPDATLTINGTTDGREETNEGGAMKGNGAALAMSRAEAVRKYIATAWRIAPERLIVTTSTTPKNPSSTEYAEGFEENRRVELSSSSDILRPIVHERFREETATPALLPLSLTATSRIGVRDWHLAIRKSGATVYETAGTDAPPQTIEWKPAAGQVESIAKTLNEHDSLQCELTASATNGAQSTVSIALPASKTVNPLELSRLSLIVFDFDQSDINRQNQRMISQFVKKSLYPASTVTIIGSTDNLGELQHNQKLSEDRAFHVRDLLLADKPDAKITETKGIGPSNLLYDNHLPEGRYYCRTVRVEVETPLESILKAQ
ncbi:MAG: OmpA family protein [Bacteroidota bacterium]|nr:OmpA family protein [Bacteroidota bacterium]MDP4233193.1 OmpA family protein [Bacteroidota bacterium]MDP4242188.1 OmpA family protein [Bacteroidota bacterium]MDP4287839.1 OmpA family protein [Bacteroidota bacterium]